MSCASGERCAPGYQKSRIFRHRTSLRTRTSPLNRPAAPENGGRMIAQDCTAHVSGAFRPGIVMKKKSRPEKQPSNLIDECGAEESSPAQPAAPGR
jgi:hypothetical protein